MQEHAFEAVLLQGAVQGEVAVFVVTRNGVAAAGQVHADLVGAAGFDGDFQQAALGQAGREGGQALLHAHEGDGAQALRVVTAGDLHAALAFASRASGHDELAQRRVNHFAPGRPCAQRQREIGFAGGAVAELVLQLLEGAAFFGDEQDAAGFAVQPVHQLQIAGLRTGAAQLLDDGKAHAGAAMHGHASGFVNGDEVLVFHQHGEFARGSRRLGPGGNADGRHAHGVARLQARVGAGARLVHAHFAAADDAVDMCFGHALEMPHEKVVQPLAGAFGVHGQGAGLAGAGQRQGRAGRHESWHGWGGGHQREAQHDARGARLQ